MKWTLSGATAKLFFFPSSNERRELKAPWKCAYYRPWLSHRKLDEAKQYRGKYAHICIDFVLLPGYYHLPEPRSRHAVLFFFSFPGRCETLSYTYYSLPFSRTMVVLGVDVGWEWWGCGGAGRAWKTRRFACRSVEKNIYTISRFKCYTSNWFKTI